MNLARTVPLQDTGDRLGGTAMDTTQEGIGVRRDAPVATVVLSRPDALNALTKPWLLSVARHFELDVRANDSVDELRDSGR